jgi:hypothetical protein
MADATFTLDQTTIQTLVQQAVEDKITNLVKDIVNDVNWVTRIERLVNDRVTHETLIQISSTNISEVIKERVDENLRQFKQSLVGIDDQATATQLTVMDDTTVVENILTTRELHVVNGATINHLAVKGSINTENPAWATLAESISTKTLSYLNEEWREQLVQEVSKQIQDNGINFDEILVNNQPLVNGNKLSATITDSMLKSVGSLHSLSVAGPVNLNDTLVTNKNRVGINTDAPETALSVWDEEVTINIGKFKTNEAYIGTSRLQNLSLGVNRAPQIEIGTDGITTIKKLRVGVNIISHAVEVPGWSGTRGDIVFNGSPKDDGIFAWVCLGAFQWKALKSAS